MICTRVRKFKQLLLNKHCGCKSKHICHTPLKLLQLTTSLAALLNRTHAIALTFLRDKYNTLVQKKKKKINTTHSSHNSNYL